MRCCPWYRAHLKWSEIVSRVNSPLVPLRLDTLTPLVPRSLVTRRERSSPTFVKQLSGQKHNRSEISVREGWCLACVVACTREDHVMLIRAFVGCAALSCLVGCGDGPDLQSANLSGPSGVADVSIAETSSAFAATANASTDVKVNMQDACDPNTFNAGLGRRHMCPERWREIRRFHQSAHEARVRRFMAFRPEDGQRANR